ncbi:hypothetical protein ACEQ8H_007971 [Pleosporales sp. CAS-2024a]
MPMESDSKTSSQSQNSLQGLLAKCGITLPLLSVRDRNPSPEHPNRPVMTVADSPKKRRRRRRRMSSPLPSRRRQTSHPEAKSSLDKAESLPTARDFFDAIIVDTKAVHVYSSKHAELLQKEDEHAWDRESRPRPTSRSQSDMDEQDAARIIRAMREYERKVVFGNVASEAIPGAHTRDMGGQFLTNKERIDNESELFKIAHKMPKGALLHLHFNAELHPERLLERARFVDNLYIRSIRPLSTIQDLNETEMVLNVLDPDQIEQGVDIFSNDYPGDANNWKTDEWKWRVWMPWKKFQKDFETHFPGEYVQSQPMDTSTGATCCSEPFADTIALNPAEYWLKTKMVLSEKEAYGLDQTVNGVWARFNQATRCFKGLLNYEGVYKWYIGQAIDRMIEENVMYAELRPMFLDKFIPTNDGKGQINNTAQMQLIIDGVHEKQAQLKKEKRLHKFPFGLKIIYCTPRSIPKKMMQEQMKLCIELKEAFPHLICGFDLVGAEDRPNHIGFYKEELVAFKKTCEARNIDIPFLFHAGETLLDTGGSSDPNNSNLYDAVVLESKRIGHGFALMKHPHLIDKFKKTKESPGICIELCPISNELLHLCRNIKEHPFPELLAAGIPCTLNSDNPSLFSNSMSHEFYQIMVGAPTISLYSWKQLARWSLEYSCLSVAEIQQGQTILASDWKLFCKFVKDEYGPLVVDNDIDEAKVQEQAKYRWRKQ